MDTQAKTMIDDLFGKLAQAEQQTGPRDGDAEALIGDALSKQPNAPYYMAQTILVQEHALNELNRKVEELQQQHNERPAGGGGFLGGLFGGGKTAPAQRSAAAGRQPPPSAAPFRNAPQGSFLGGAMQTALGVAGGVMLASAVTGMFADDAAAAEPAAEEPPVDDMPVEEPAVDDGWGFDGGDEEF